MVKVTDVCSEGGTTEGDARQRQRLGWNDASGECSEKQTKQAKKAARQNMKNKREREREREGGGGRQADKQADRLADRV